QVGIEPPLQPCVEGDPTGTIGPLRALLDEPVRLRVHVAAAVESVRRTEGGVKTQAVDVRVADVGPVRGHDLEASRAQIVIEGRPLEGEDVERDTDLREILLEDGGELR